LKRVAELYNQTKDGSSAFRDFESIFEKWTALENSQELTGDCPPFVVRAKTISKKEGENYFLKELSSHVPNKLLKRLRKLLGSLNEVTAIFPQLKITFSN
jgi:hypothetical protein